MWKYRKAKDYFGSEQVQGELRDCISQKTIKGLLERLAMAEGWLLKYLLGNDHSVKAAAVNVRVLAKKNNVEPKVYFGDLYLIQNIKNRKVSFKLYCPKDNQFVWSIDANPDLDGYLDLKCNTHVFHQGDWVYTFKFPDKKEKCLFRDSVNKFLFFEKNKR